LLIAFFLALPALAIESVKVEATARSEHEAIQYALAEAVRRVNGASVETGGVLRPEVQEAVRRIEIDFDPKLTDVFHIRSLSNGYVRSYAVLSSKRGQAGVTVELEAQVLSFDPDNPRPGARKTIVVDPFSLAPGALVLDQPATGSEALLAGLRDDLTSSLVQSRKFSVLTRKNLAGVLAEQTFIAGGRVGTSEKAKLQNLLGADYLVSGSIDRIYVHTSSSTVKLTGYTTYSKVADCALTLTVYNVGSGQIEWTESYARSYSWDDDALKADPEFKNDGTVARTMILEGAAQLTRLMIRRSFPPKVVDVDIDAPGFPVFFLNAGSALYAVGDELDLIAQGKALTDPDTGEVLGHRERIVGILRITRQDDKLSQAVLVDATADQLAWVKSEAFDPTQLLCRLRPARSVPD
jgi:hypothetical protein